MIYVAYYRVLATKQGATGSSLDAQRAAVAAYLEQREVSRLDEYTENQTGKKTARPELDKALRRCQSTGATLVIAKLNSMSHDAGVIYQLKDAGVDFVTIEIPEAAKPNVGLIASIARHERNIISERTKASLAAAKASGKVLGNPHLDRDRNTDTTAATAKNADNARKHLTELAELIKQFEADAGGVLTVDELVTLLNDAGYRSRRGCLLSRTQVYRAKRLSKAD